MSLMKITADGIIQMTPEEEIMQRTIWANSNPKGLHVGARAQIAELEAQQTPRRISDFIAGDDDGWLLELRAQIAAMRALL